LTEDSSLGFLKKTSREINVMKKSPLFCFACVGLLSLSEVSARKLEWMKDRYSTWISHYGSSTSDPDRFSQLKFRYNDELYPIAVLRFGSIEPDLEEVINFLNGNWLTFENWRAFSGYLLLHEEIKEWLRRLGAVTENKEQENEAQITTTITFNRKLSVTYVIHHRPAGSGDLSSKIWHCNVHNNSHKAAIKFLSLSQAQMSFVAQFDQSDSKQYLRVCSLPNGFLLRTIRAISGQNPAQEATWWSTQIMGDVDTDENFAFAAILVFPEGDIEVVVEIFWPFNETIPTSGTEIKPKLNEILKLFTCDKEEEEEETKETPPPVIGGKGTSLSQLRSPTPSSCIEEEEEEEPPLPPEEEKQEAPPPMIEYPEEEEEEEPSSPTSSSVSTTTSISPEFT
jgi:hypothetical protein